MPEAIPGVGQLAGLCAQDETTGLWEPLKRDASGALRTLDPRFRGVSYNYDNTNTATTDIEMISFASGYRCRVKAIGLTGTIASYNDIGLNLYVYNSVGTKEVLSPHYSGTIAELIAGYNPFYETTTAFVPNIYHVYRYVAAGDWSMRIIFVPALEASYGFGLRLLNPTGAPRRFFGSVIAEVGG